MMEVIALNNKKYESPVKSNNFDRIVDKKVNNNMNQSKALPEVFKELEEIRKAQAISQNKPKKLDKNLKTNKVNKKRKKRKANKSNTKNNINRNITNITTKITPIIPNKLREKDPVAITLLGVVALLGITMFSNSYIFAREDSDTEQTPKEIIGTFEKNENIINISEILSNNINTTESKEVLTGTRAIEFETEYYANPNLPKDELMVTQEGVLGEEEVTFIRTYLNSEIVNDNIININRISEPIPQKVDVGTNEFLAKQQIHIGDQIYAKERTYFFTEPNTSADLIGVIVKYYDVTLLEVLEDWCKVQIFDYVGYVTTASLESSKVDSSLPEKCRKQKIIKNVSEDMAINRPSGMSLEDFKTALSNNSLDRNKIFEDNAEVFYNMEQKYGINGLFLASIGIHESGWGTSNIAANKKNLFGYGAYDWDPYNMSYSFETYEEGIELVAKMLVKYYINSPGTPIFENQTAVGSYYNGSTIAAVNIRYASDKEWHTKVFNTMNNLYKKIEP